MTGSLMAEADTESDLEALAFRRGRLARFLVAYGDRLRSAPDALSGSNHKERESAQELGQFARAASCVVSVAVV
jgi:hypothetical protein